MATSSSNTATFLCLLQILASLLLVAPQREEQSNGNSNGEWGLLKRSIGISAMHVALLPTGKLVAFDRTDFGTSNISLPHGRCRNDSRDTALKHDCTAHAVELDPSTRRVRALTVLTDTFCSSGTLSRSGILVQTGGFNDGARAVRYLSACDSCDWTEDANGLAVPRWYATNHLLPDGRAIVVGGRREYSYEFVPKTKPDERLFSLPFLRETNDEHIENNLYPFVHLNTDGHLFIFANTKSILLDYTSNTVVRRFPDMPGGMARNYPSSGSSVLLPLRLTRREPSVAAEVMVCGGALPTAYTQAHRHGKFLPASGSCGRLVITDKSPEWVMEAMPLRRVMGDMLLLPTGRDVLIVNGAANGTAGWLLGRDPVLHPVLYKIGVGGERRRYDVLQPAATPRMYHSTAHLMPDGRVFVGGSNPNVRYDFTGVLFPTDLSAEVFRPPYLSSRNSHPKIHGIAPATVAAYGAKLTIEVEVKHGNIHVPEVEVTMVSPAFTTHSFSMNQRLLVLDVESVKAAAAAASGRWQVSVFAPGSAVLAPPGYYMVFAVVGGVPSRARWIQMVLKKQ